MVKVLLGKKGQLKKIYTAAAALIVLLLVAFVFLKGGPFGISGFLVFQQTSQSDFDTGTYNNTAYDAAGYVKLSSGNTEGTYTSKVFDADTTVVWNNISWGEGLQYQEEFSSDNNTLGLYHFNDDISDNSFEDSASGYTASIIGGVSQGGGKFSNAAVFNGNDGNYLNISERTAFDINSGTTEFWFKPSTTYTSGLNEEKLPYVRKVSAQNNLRISFESNTSKLKFRIRKANTNYNALSAQATWNAGTWYFAAVTWGSDGMKLYVNGMEEGSNSFTGAPDWADEGDLHFGADSDGTKAFYGSMDELRVSNVQKSAAEILNDYKRGILNLRFQARSSNDNASWGDFAGDYATPPSNLNAANNRYFQYLAHFSTENATYTPELYNVTINYEDTIAPSVSFASPTPNNENLTQNWTYINVTISENANSTNLEWNGVNETLGGSGTNWYLNKTELANGNYTFRVYATDISNNAGISELRWVSVYVAPPIPTPPTPAPSPAPTATTTGGGTSAPSPAPVPIAPSPPAPEIVEENVTTEEEVEENISVPTVQPEQNVTTPPPSAFTVFVNAISSRNGIAVIGATAIIIVLASFAVYRRIRSKPTEQSQRDSGENQPAEGQL